MKRALCKSSKCLEANGKSKECTTGIEVTPTLDERCPACLSAVFWKSGKVRSRHFAVNTKFNRQKRKLEKHL